MTRVELIDQPDEALTYGLPCSGAGVRVFLRSGREIAARALVHCGVHKRKCQPEWVNRVACPLPGRIAHAEDVDVKVFGDSLQNQRVCIVGGGMVAASLCLAAASRGAIVTLVHRSAIHRQEADIDPAFFGGKGRSQMRQCRDDYCKRLELCYRARPHASINRYMWKQLQSHIKTESLAVLQHTEITSVRWDENQKAFAIEATTSDTESPEGVHQESKKLSNLISDYVWLATGVEADVRHDVILPRLAEQCPVRLYGGLPALRGGNCELCWPGAPVIVLGGAAALQIGPAAGMPQGYRFEAEAVASSLELLDASPESFVACLAAAAGEIALLEPLTEELDDAMIQALKHHSAPAPSLKDSSRVHVDDVRPELPRKRIDKFDWWDEDGQMFNKIIVHLPDEARLTRDRVRLQIRIQELEMWVVGDTACWHLHFPKLYRQVIVEKCTCKVLTAARKVVIALHKVSSNPWRFVRG